MYHTCIYCSADLKTNAVLERFPVGRSIAFDAEKGRLWSVCARCARWNLAPLEERWEAIEDAERLFRDTRTRVQRENIGLAKLRDGTRLVRVGDALAGELAAWRYGRTLELRRRRGRLAAGMGAVVMAGVSGLSGVLALGTLAVAAPAVVGGALAGIPIAWEVSGLIEALRHTRPVVHQARIRYGPRDMLVRVLRQHLPGARLQPDFENRDIELHVPALWGGYGVERFGHDAVDPIVLRGTDAARVLGNALVSFNRAGARPRDVELALLDIEEAGSPHELLMQVARRRQLLNGVEVPDWLQPPYAFRYTDPGRADTRTTLALEMALHEETERRALEGELAALEEMWRQAEAVAAIADRLPDHLPPPEPPRI